MGRPWNEALRVVTLPKSLACPVTIIVPFYENAGFLRQQLRGWWDYSPSLRWNLSAVIVDDCSPTPAYSVLRDVQYPFPIRLFRIDRDVRWNWLAARNIGFHHAPDGWCLVTDMDHVIPNTTALTAVYGLKDPRAIYGFSRSESSGESIGPHCNSWLMTRKMFWKVGGYDERLSGYYGTDGDWRRRMAKVAPIEILTDRLIRYERIGDSSTTRYKRKQPEDAAVSKIIAKRKPGWTPKTLSFPYAEVELKEAACSVS